MNFQLKEFKIKAFSVRETAAKKKMGNLQLEECETKEIINCVIWEECLNGIEKVVLRTGNIVSIADGIYNEQYKNINIKRLKLIKEAKTGLDEAKREEIFKNILEEVNSFENEDFKKAIMQIIFENENLFKVSPAAKNNHHNYIGGLMQHIWECIEVAKLNFKFFKQPVDKELVVAACITHDIGKIFEYIIDENSGIVEIDEDFQKKWISHIHYGFSWANHNGFHDLARIIAAHHGRTDWGALIDLNERDIEPVLYLMHHIDDISAKFGAISVEDLDQANITA